MTTTVLVEARCWRCQALLTERAAPGTQWTCRRCKAENSV